MAAGHSSRSHAGAVAAPFGCLGRMHMSMRAGIFSSHIQAGAESESMLPCRTIFAKLLFIQKVLALNVKSGAACAGPLSGAKGL
ncbi:hypothetical protein Tel_05945 [Candidatus Tenderia electrophaga]|jgi:hypothetical protein|uniref:Uncharacterized protein n=1 Tax=Candidatus Tenderia electrophaga TaxID=1748243 RepID=A0A0S2TC59_9GAMM|nr:hypothetical protein Tel_05945 [Candidatus Tenderia electrophaga]